MEQVFGNVKISDFFSPNHAMAEHTQVKQTATLFGVEVVTK